MHDHFQKSIDAQLNEKVGYYWFIYFTLIECTRKDRQHLENWFQNIKWKYYWNEICRRWIRMSYPKSFGSIFNK